MPAERAARRSRVSDPPVQAQAAEFARGIAQLAGMLAVEVTDVVEGVHQSVWNTLGVRGRAPLRSGGLTGRIYDAVRLGARASARVAGGAAAGLLPAGLLPSLPRRRVAAVLNGVFGDRLAASGNPLALPMSVHTHAMPLDPLRPGDAIACAWRGTAPPRRLVLMVHGMCLDACDWWELPGGPRGHAGALARAAGAMPLALRYNSGLAIAANGEALSRLLDALVRHWPAPLESVDVVAHSMGGLVLRSALRAAQADGAEWPGRLGRVAFLGTPHLGAPLEQLGHHVHALLARQRWLRPFAGLAALRSRGIHDLREGCIVARDPDAVRFDAASPGAAGVGAASVARLDAGRAADSGWQLPSGLAALAVAGKIAAPTPSRGRRWVSGLGDGVLGDGLVPIASALGEDPAAGRSMRFERQHVATGVGHLALLSDPGVRRQLCRWLRAAPPPERG